MRIAMFSRLPKDPDHPKGGVESATMGLVRGLSARPDVDLHVVTLEKGLDQDVEEKTPYATVHRLAAPRRPMILDVFGGPGRQKIDQCIRALQPDVVHFQETYGFGGPYADIPTVFTVHGFDSLNLVTERKYAWRLRAPLWEMAEKRGIGSHQHLISIAPYVTEKLVELSNADVTEIPNAMNPEFFDLQPNPVPGRIFFAGWINRRKNVGAAIRATKILADQDLDVSLHAAGDFSDPEYLAEVRALIDELDVAARVKLMGRVGQDVLRRELEQANVFLLPSLQENAPMAIAEAMAAGVPIVTSNVCGMPTMIDEGQTGFLIEPNDVDTIANRLGVILRDAQTRETMGRHAREKSRSTYHPDSVVSATFELYERIRAAA